METKTFPWGVCLALLIGSTAQAASPDQLTEDPFQDKQQLPLSSDAVEPVAEPRALSFSEVKFEPLDQAQPSSAIAPTRNLPANLPANLSPNLRIAQSMQGAFEDEDLVQVTSVSQLADVQPTDWAFQALQSLVERYGCIAGYPDGTYKGNRAMTRYEFAAGLYSCLSRVNELIGAATADKVSRDDLAIIQRLQEEFAAELAGLAGRITALESRTAELEANQFSTTTVFGGEAIFGLGFAGGGVPPGNEDDRQAVFHYLLRLGMVSSFSGLDRLRIGLLSGNFANRGYAGTVDNPSLATDMALLSYQADTQDDVILDSLEYRFPAFNNRVVFTVKPLGFSLSDVLTANSPFFDTGRGSISRFGEANPIFKIGALEGGFGTDWLVTNRLRLQVAYGTRGINDATQGMFNSDHSALGVQLLAKPSANTLAGLTYINSYSSNGFLDRLTGSFNADSSGLISEPMQFNTVGASFQWRVNRKITLAAWGGVTFGESTISDAYANTTTYTVSFGLSDPFNREGDLFAVIFGQPPKLEEGRGLLEGDDPDTSLHIETFYRFRVNDYIWLTPGVFVVTDPEHNSDNDTLVIGVLRGAFLF
ncbi:iron uptake porin [Limnoraphis robusta]|uniref:Iron uptake porin n=1 Tax=Limnoraphis robusta CCNP1315 TaxID=3110306 RepID=A0ABU5TRJ3_9CYAN|nr:iron uptake porin [Limnoraphis robusta]MEA5497552.1 iron uptake porin [Limnoraphis robusta BA-68 BA1]MEA5517335.1 iron uptake porin [Limnoraphis robusta CCNP1315]MEA5546076.1 iron uptake porin [Limnoraphis robusta CCNP1324]